MENKSAIVIANPAIAEKLQNDLSKLGFPNSIGFSSIDCILKKKATTPPDLLILELKGEKEVSFLDSRAKIYQHYGSSFPILLLTDERLANHLINKRAIKNSGYISYSYTLRELDLCIDSSVGMNGEIKTKHVWLDQLGLNTLVDLLPNGILVCDEFGRILDVNHALCNILGYSYIEFCTMSIKDLVPKEKYESIDLNINKIFKGETLRSEVVNICKDGSRKFLEIIETRILLSNGSYGLLIISSDISKWKEVHEEITESEEKYRILVEKSNDGILFIQDGKLIYGNPKIIEMIGISSNEFIGQPFEKYLHSSEIDKVKVQHHMRLSGEFTPEIYETVIQRNNGDSLPVEINANLAFYKGNSTIVVFIRDISSRKLTEKFLKESEESYRSVFDNASEAIYIQDSNGVFLDVNRAALELYGYAKSEIVGTTPEKLSAPGKNDINDTIRRLKEAFEGKTQIFEFWGLSKSGREFPKEVIFNKGKYFGADVVFAMARDISDRKNTEEILLESEEKYRTLAEQIPVGIYRTTEEGEFYYANPALAHILGFDSVDDLVTHNVNEFYLDPNERTETLNLIRNSKGYVQREQQLKRRDGKQIWVRDNGKATLQSNGNLLFFDGVVENITDQKEITEALKKSEANLRTVLKAIPDLIFRFNSEGKYIDFYSNPNEYLSILPETIIGESIYNFFPIEFSEQVIKSINTCLNTGTLQTIEYSTTFNGEIHYYEARIVPAGKDEVLSLARDITSRIKAQEKINMLAQTIMNILECISITDINDKIIYVNPALLETYGYEENEIIGMDISILRSPSVQEDLSKEIYNCTLSGGWQGEIKNIRKDGQEFPISLSTAIVHDNNGQPVAFVGVANDITERKVAEQDLINAKEKAEESDRLKTSFLANMSHEIRSPMNAILGFIRIIKDEEDLSENGKQYIDLISGSGAQLISVIEDILDTSKIQANQLRLSVREFDLNALLTNLFNNFSSQAKSRSKTNTILLPPTLPNPSPFLINSDDLRIRQIITNLLSNALKFTPKGIIEFGYSMIIDDENPVIQFFVKDTGIGLAPDKLTLIFERFRQADDSYTRMYGGSGLGLAISKGLVELLGGKIWVESKESKGSTFFFSLPLKSLLVDSNKRSINKISEKQINRVEGLDWSDKTIFIVEDIVDIQYFLKRVLARTGANFLFASSLSEARAIFSNSSKIDLVLLDIRLPDGDGYSLCTEFKGLHPKIPIIAQTAYAMQGEKEKSASFGCDDFITKPIDADLLYLKIDNLFKRGV